MSDELKMQCGTCAFYGPIPPPKGMEKEEGRGFCHFNPPTPVLMPRQSQIAMQKPEMKFTPQGIRPPVFESDFCGRWQPNAETHEAIIASTKGCEGDCGEGCTCGN